MRGGRPAVDLKPNLTVEDLRNARMTQSATRLFALGMGAPVESRQ
jgi:hypothetical protein